MPDFCRISLPIRNPGPDAAEWVRVNGSRTYVLHPQSVMTPGKGITHIWPYGKKARLLMVWISTQVVRQKKHNTRRVIMLPSILRQLMEDLGHPTQAPQNQLRGLQTPDQRPVPLRHDYNRNENNHGDHLAGHQEGQPGRGIPHRVVPLHAQERRHRRLIHPAHPGDLGQDGQKHPALSRHGGDPHIHRPRRGIRHLYMAVAAHIRAQPFTRLPDPAHRLEIAPEPNGLELRRNTKLRHQIQTVAEACDRSLEHGSGRYRCKGQTPLQQRERRTPPATRRKAPPESR